MCSGLRFENFGTVLGLAVVWPRIEPALSTRLKAQGSAF